MPFVLPCLISMGLLSLLGCLRIVYRGKIEFFVHGSNGCLDHILEFFLPSNSLRIELGKHETLSWGKEVFDK